MKKAAIQFNQLIFALVLFIIAIIIILAWQTGAFSKVQTAASEILFGAIPK